MLNPAVPPIPEDLPDPQDRAQAWSGNEPAYLSWWRHYNQYATTDRSGKTITELGRDDLVRLYAYAIPNGAALECLLEQGPLLEVGAGAGYWARLLRDLGGDVVAYDLYPPAENTWLRGSWLGRPPRVAPNWTMVEVGDHTMVARHPTRAVFICMPPRPDRGVIEILERYRPATIALVTGVLADTRLEGDFYPVLEQGWQRTRLIDLPQWSTRTDNLSIWQRKSLAN